MTSTSVATKVWCVRPRHRLRVNRQQVRNIWDGMNEVEKKNRTKSVPAFCPDPKCPEHGRTCYVGIGKIPKLDELTDD